jgi:hypothetical protein
LLLKLQKPCRLDFRSAISFPVPVDIEITAAESFFPAGTLIKRILTDRTHSTMAGWQ